MNKPNRKVVDSYYNDGVSRLLIKEDDEYKIERKDGRYKYVKSLGKISEEEAEGRFHYE